jgi:hypothetical protein
MEEHKKQSNNSQNLNNMEKQIVYVPHKIESEKDFPKKDGYYFCHLREPIAGNHLIVSFYTKGLVEYSWIDFDYWLEERELPSEEDIEDSMRIFCESGTYHKLEGFRFREWMRHWLKNKLI